MPSQKQTMQADTMRELQRQLHDTAWSAYPEDAQRVLYLALKAFCASRGGALNESEAVWIPMRDKKVCMLDIVLLKEGKV